MTRDEEERSEFVADKDEYLAIIQKMSSNEAWAYSFVALYFAFLASIGALLGYLLGSGSDAADRINASVAVFGATIHLVDCLCFLGIALNIWAISMVVDYKMSTKRLMQRLQHLEVALCWADHGPPGIGHSYNRDHMTVTWRAGQIVLVGSVMVLFFAPWLLVLFAP